MIVENEDGSRDVHRAGDWERRQPPEGSERSLELLVLLPDGVSNRELTGALEGAVRSALLGLGGELLQFSIYPDEDDEGEVGPDEGPEPEAERLLRERTEARTTYLQRLREQGILGDHLAARMKAYDQLREWADR